MGIDPVKDPAAARAKIGWMPDTLGVWEALTAREILTTMAKFYHLPKEPDSRPGARAAGAGQPDLPGGPEGAGALARAAAAAEPGPGADP